MATILEQCKVQTSPDTVTEAYFLDTIVPRLKQSLSLTLKHFLPLAGNIVHPIDSGRPMSRYALPPASISNDSVIFPVLSLQVTLFPEHGMCFGFTNHHAIGDASTIVRFVKAWASVTKFDGEAKLIDDKSLPFYERTGVEDSEGLDSLYWELLKKSRPVESPPLTFPLNKVRATFIITRDDIQKLKNIVLAKRPNMAHLTTFTVVCAHLWVCLVKSRAEEVGEDEPEYFGFAADCRARLSPSLPSNYFGNCLAFVKAESTHGGLKGNDGFLIAAILIGEAIRLVFDSWMELRIGHWNLGN
ncbi:HXXXD-type acyl-transferase family protein [Abeliophyllum distichum]|uniref:HXXXD-type acyl-transferase family protein n=1 Tax=Abeliophyllum distichum TaxID=126358 RepID=A0ABD1PSS8_9LAMI